MVAAGGGGLISQKPAAYSGDGKFVICPCGRKLNVYSAVTGELVGHLRGHTAEVTAVVLNPHDKSQVSKPYPSAFFRFLVREIRSRARIGRGMYIKQDGRSSL